jgi:hypothetical protein
LQVRKVGSLFRVGVELERTVRALVCQRSRFEIWPTPDEELDHNRCTRKPQHNYKIIKNRSRVSTKIKDTPCNFLKSKSHNCGRAVPISSPLPNISPAEPHLPASYWPKLSPIVYNEIRTFGIKYAKKYASSISPPPRLFLANISSASEAKLSPKIRQSDTEPTTDVQRLSYAS